MTAADPRDWLVAHRGHAARFPENSLSALDSAATCGLGMLEFDLQFTADEVPVVVHDPSLRRTGGVDRSVRSIASRDLVDYPVGYPERFGFDFADEPLLRLADLVAYLQPRPHLTPVVEIKGEGAQEIGVDRAVARVLGDLEPVLDRCILISFVERVVQSARRLGAARTGWCLHYYDADAERMARCLAPEFLLVNYRNLPPASQPLWPGQWQWMAWEVTDAGTALALRERGIDFVETMACADLLADPRLAGGPGSSW